MLETLTGITRLDLDIYISLLGKYYYSFVSESIRKNNGKLTFACYPDDRFTPPVDRPAVQPTAAMLFHSFH